MRGAVAWPNSRCGKAANAFHRQNRRLITASQLYNHLTCPHRVSMDAYADPADREEPNPFIELLWERGSLFERDTIGKLGEPFTDLSTLAGDDKERATR